MENPSPKTADANNATFAALNIRVFEETDQTGKQPANQSTLYGKPRTKRKSQTNFFGKPNQRATAQTKSPPSRSNPHGPANGKPQARTTSPNKTSETPGQTGRSNHPVKETSNKAQSHRSQ